MSHVEFKKMQMSPLNFHVPCRVYIRLIWYSNSRDTPCHVPYFYFSFHEHLCRMSILRNSHVAVSSLGVKGNFIQILCLANKPGLGVFQ